MILKKTYILLILSVSLTACGFISNKDKKVNMKTKEETVAEKTIDDYTDTYTITPKTDLPKFKELTAAFEKQAHRFEIEKCQFKYNGQSFFIGDSPEKIIQIFGEPDRKIESETQNIILFDYKKMKIEIKFSYTQKTLSQFILKMTNYKEEDNNELKIVKFQKVPYRSDMTLNEFMALSDLTYENLRRSRFHFFMLQKECTSISEETLCITFDSDPVYEVEGGGHLTWTGDFNPNESNLIKGIYVDIKKTKK